MNSKPINILLKLDEIFIIINKLKQIIQNKDYIVLLQGDLASGKTTLVQEYLKSLNIKQNATSPTFTLQNCYTNNIYHYDIYNKTLNEFIQLGLLEEFEKKGLHFVEWGEDDLKKLLIEYGFRVITLQIIKQDNKRRYTINS